MGTSHPIAPRLNRTLQHLKELSGDLLIYLGIASIFALAVALLFLLQLLFV